MKNNKTQPTEDVKKYKIGEKDDSGHIIVEILSKNNEYVIYEIDTPDINNKLRVIIDGHTDESEKKITDRFNLVKQKFIEAKGLLYRSQNYGMMKNRVAHALSTALSSNNQNPNEEFDELIKQIKSETKKALNNRIYYLLPASIIFISFFCIVFFYNVEACIFSVLFGASLGGILSLLIFINNKHFEEFSEGYYLILGLERIFLSNITAIIVYVLIKAGIVLPSLSDSSMWLTISIGIIAGFSETLAPSLLNKIEQNNN